MLLQPLSYFKITIFHRLPGGQVRRARQWVGFGLARFFFYQEHCYLWLLRNIKRTRTSALKGQWEGLWLRDRASAQHAIPIPDISSTLKLTPYLPPQMFSAPAYPFYWTWQNDGAEFQYDCISNFLSRPSWRLTKACLGQ